MNRQSSSSSSNFFKQFQVLLKNFCFFIYYSQEELLQTGLIILHSGIRIIYFYYRVHDVQTFGIFFISNLYSAHFVPSLIITPARTTLCEAGEAVPSRGSITIEFFCCLHRLSPSSAPASQET